MTKVSVGVRCTVVPWHCTCRNAMRSKNAIQRNVCICYEFLFFRGLVVLFVNHFGGTIIDGGTQPKVISHKLCTCLVWMFVSTRLKKISPHLIHTKQCENYTRLVFTLYCLSLNLTPHTNTKAYLNDSENCHNIVLVNDEIVCSKWKISLRNISALCLKCIDWTCMQMMMGYIQMLASIWCVSVIFLTWVVFTWLKMVKHNYAFAFR